MKTLTSVIFKNAKRREKTSKNENTALILSGLSFVIVFGALAGFMIWASIYITKRLGEFEQNYAFVNMMLFANFGILFIKSVFETLNVLYFSKDLKIFLRMPIKSKDIVHGKLLKMITSEYEMEIIMLAIPMIVYGIMENADFRFFLYIPAILIVLPIIPISITSVVVAIIMRFTNRLKNKSKAMYLTIIISCILIDAILIVFRGDGFSKDLFENAIITENGLATEIANNFKLIKPIMNTLLNCNNSIGLKNMLYYTLASIGTYIITLNIISPIYLKGVIGTIINGDKKKIKEKTNLTIKDFKQKSMKKAYILKEYKIISRSPIFFIQCILLPVLFAFAVLLIAISMVAVTKVFGFNMISQITEKANKSWGAGAFLSIAQVFYMINFTSIIAVSKEERWAILSKYIPIKLSKQLNMKLLIGKISNFIASLAVVYWYYVCTLNIKNTIFIFVISLGLNIIGEKVKILIDLRNPKINWDNEYTMMKQNTNVMYELFYTMVVMFIMVTMGFIIQNLQLYMIIMTLMVLIINGIFNRYFWNNDKKIFEKLY